MKVIVFNGHMIDRPGRHPDRFPPGKERVVRERLALILSDWETGEESIAIGSGARGSDILCAELCLARGARVILLIPLPKEEFLATSVRLPDSDWEERFDALLPRCEVKYQHETLGPVPEGMNVFERNNLWCIDMAREYAGKGEGHALLVWDEKPTGDGPGGTCHLAAKVQQLGWRRSIVNPTNL